MAGRRHIGTLDWFTSMDPPLLNTCYPWSKIDYSALESILINMLCPPSQMELRLWRKSGEFQRLSTSSVWLTAYNWPWRTYSTRKKLQQRKGLPSRKCVMMMKMPRLVFKYNFFTFFKNIFKIQFKNSQNYFIGHCIKNQWFFLFL